MILYTLHKKTAVAHFVRSNIKHTKCGQYVPCTIGENVIFQKQTSTLYGRLKMYISESDTYCTSI